MSLSQVMSVNAKNVPPRPAFSFFECAAWISVSLAAFSGLISIFPFYEGDALLAVYNFAFGCLVVSLILGVASLLGFRKHRSHFTVWIGGMGVFISGGLIVGFVIFFVSLLSGFGHQ
jgi:hypothetical protein